MKTGRIHGQSGRLGCMLLIFMILVISYGSAFAEIIPGNRMVTWQGNVGVKGDIPVRTTIFASVKDAPYNAAGNGTVDDTAAIQNAINNCPPGQVVFIPAGTYKITGKIRLKSNVTVRGAGSSTLIKGASGFEAQFLIGAMDNGFIWDLSYPAAVDLASGYTKGSTTVTTSGPHGLSPGDIIDIDQLEDPTGDPPITTLGGSGRCSWCGRASGARPIGQWDKVVATPSPTTLTLEIPLYWNYNPSKSPQLVKVLGITENAGFENLTVDNTDSSANYIIQFAMTSNCWLLGVEAIGSYKRSVSLYGAYRCTIRTCSFHEGIPATPYVGAQYGVDRAYGISMGPWASACLIEDNQLYNLSFAIGHEGSVSGNVLGYNYCDFIRYSNGDWCRLTIGCHGAHPMMNLWEGNYIVDKLDADWYWGTSSHQTIFRNRQFNAPGRLYGFWGVDLYKGAHYYNVVANVFGTVGNENNYEITGAFNYMGDKSIFKLGFVDAGSSADGNDSGVSSTLLRHGNWDSVNKSVVWNPTISDKTLPNSFYLTDKPSWWDQSTPDKYRPIAWPAFGPSSSTGQTPLIGALPAQKRYAESSAFAPPRNLKVSP